jgi:hypothetical protein
MRALERSKLGATTRRGGVAPLSSVDGPGCGGRHASGVRERERDTACGAGPEIDVTIAPIRGQVSVRYEHDLIVRARPHRQVFVIQLVVAVWGPGRVLDLTPGASATSDRRD